MIQSFLLSDGRCVYFQIVGRTVAQCGSPEEYLVQFAPVVKGCVRTVIGNGYAIDEEVFLRPMNQEDVA